MLAHNRIAVMHGVNLDQLGRRDAAHYGGMTYDHLEQAIARDAEELGLQPNFFQSNHEGAFVEHLHGLDGLADGLIINPGAWTHYSYAIRDALTPRPRSSSARRAAAAARLRSRPAPGR